MRVLRVSTAGQLLPDGSGCGAILDLLIDGGEGGTCDYIGASLRPGGVRG